jgi:hypothetical protein
MTRARGAAPLRARAAAPWLVLVLGASCARELTLGSDEQRTSSAGMAGMPGAAGTTTAGVAGRSGGAGQSGSSAAGGASGASEGGAAGEAPCVRSACNGTVYACGNCMDDDGDGRIDAADLECTGPCDNKEDSLSVGLPGESSTACQEDCYFDRGNGAGKSDCHFSHRCDELAVAPDYPPTGESSCAYDENTKIPGTNASCSELRAAQPAGCTDTCVPLTPNGCDCFGCCELPPASGKYIWLETELPCTPVEACLNRCDPCEACVGRPAPLPSCGETGGTQCPGDYRACGPASGDSCQVGAYCITGCCIPEPR